MPDEEVERIRAVIAKHPFIRLHWDGARAWNASVATGMPLAKLARHYDSVSLCLSKGLGAPIGSVLVGSKAFVHKARELRKGMGGGWRQCGMLAAAGIYAIDKNFSLIDAVHRY